MGLGIDCAEATDDAITAAVRQAAVTLRERKEGIMFTMTH